ncbi:CDP-diacylglycerol--glycerol-3-phosphate 3-phosphatidyltransferase [uncultured Corynebacterium sp.]|uniref:CDP-diacylglycerol--glycerol-3-phosphate 3-phosphatidyltransferase n=1 Tax=uncultured Corynebacterium sp. TaxID=159447 RepID=UPI0026277141|nr:CDP-diacylglycerol--glycerol-3-phosphate 3-phosphatidyltransferase [uncultured Corynebacterium sp.]
MTAPSADTSRVSNWNLPNFLTVLRILGVPVFLWVLLQEGGEATNWRWWSFVVFTLLMATDKLDGYLARSRNLITDFGKIADPIADKALMLAALIGMNVIGILPWWVTVIIVIREGGITVWRMFALRQGRVVPASRGGKIKTVLQSVAVGLFLMPVAWLYWPSWIVMIAAIIVTVGTGIQYIVDARKAA